MKIDNTTLKPLGLKDIDFVYEIYNNPGVYETGVLSYKFQFNDLQVKNMVERWLSSDGHKHFLVYEGKDKVGLAQIFNIDYLNRKCNIGLLIEPMYSNKGIGSKVVKIINDICFNSLNLHKIEVSILNSNRKSIKLFEKLEYKREGILKESVFKNRKYEDIYLYGKIK